MEVNFTLHIKVIKTGQTYVFSIDILRVFDDHHLWHH